jgi:GTPase SAR1 family protein
MENINNNLSPRQFNLSKINKGSNITIVGRRNVGKTTLIHNILCYLNDINLGLVISASEPFNNYYEQFLPKVFIFNDYDKNITMNFFEKQRDIINKYRDNSCLLNDNNAFIVLDNMTSRYDWVNNQVSQLKSNCHNYNITQLTTVTSPYDIVLPLNDNTDYLFIFNDTNDMILKRYYNKCKGIFPNYEIFCNLFSMCTNNNYTCMVIDLTTDSNHIEDIVYWYKGDLISEDVKLGDESLWELNNNEMEEEEDDNDDE